MKCCEKNNIQASLHSEPTDLQRISSTLASTQSSHLEIITPTSECRLSQSSQYSSQSPEWNWAWAWVPHSAAAGYWTSHTDHRQLGLAVTPSGAVCAQLPSCSSCTPTTEISSVGQISNNYETSYWEEISNHAGWCTENDPTTEHLKNQGADCSLTFLIYILCKREKERAGVRTSITVDGWQWSLKDYWLILELH